MKKLMILGAGILQLPAIKRAKELGLDVIVADINPNAIGFKEEGITKLFISTTDTPGILEAAKNLNINGIMTLASDVPMPTIGIVCDKLGLNGISELTAKKATNKAEMRKCFKSYNAPIPKFSVVDNFDEFVAESKSFNGKFVVKPSDNSGNRGIKFINDEESKDIRILTEVYNYSKEFSHDGRILLEEFMEGPEFSVEGMSINGKYNVVQITDKTTSGVPYFVELGHTQPSKFDQKYLDDIADAARLGIKALGINDGPSHAEIKLTKEGAKIVEIGARLGGGFITTHLVPLSTGVDMVEASIRVALGEIPDIKQKYNRASAVRFIQPSPGILERVNGLDMAKNIEGVVEVGLLKNIGDEIPVMRNGLDRVGYVIAQGKNRDEAIRACEESMEKISIKTI